MKTTDRDLVEMFVGVLHPGDLWAANGSDIRVVSVSFLGPDDPHYPNGMRVEGVIERGFGRGRRVRSWSFHPGARVDVVREGGEDR